LRTIVVEQGAPGGQITYSGSVENYPGFPEALSGSELARRAVQQAERFGVEILVTRRATALRTEEKGFYVSLDDGTELESHSVLLALGVSFRWLEAPGCSPLVGAGIYYGAVTAEAFLAVETRRVRPHFFSHSSRVASRSSRSRTRSKQQCRSIWWTESGTRRTSS
jgi:thioredoxin reductase